MAADRRQRFASVLPVLLAAFAAGCATTAELDTTGIDKALAPPVAQRDVAAATGRRVLWGGMIMGARNLPGKTVIEVLAFPLDDRHRPEEDATATVRFIAERAGYLELADYTAGRWITVTGRVQGSRQGQVGEAAYDFPVVQTDGIHLWPKDSRGRGDTRFHFGIGIGIYR